MQSKYWCFTSYELDELPTHLGAAIGDGRITWYIYQPEICPETGRLHAQGYAVFKSKVRQNTASNILGGCHVSKRKGTHKQAKEYCTKEATRAGETCTAGQEPEKTRAGRRSDLIEFKEAVDKGATEEDLYAEHIGVMALYPQFARRYQHFVRETSFRKNIPEFTPRPGWQMDLSTLLDGTPNARTVVWRWEPIGNTGKSYFALHYKPEETFVITGGKHTDIHYAYHGQKTVFFDWARKGMEQFPYGLVEQFKNGYFLVTKYESTPFRFPPPHVVVFANQQPEFGALSQDRWDCQIIE